MSSGKSETKLEEENYTDDFSENKEQEPSQPKEDSYTEPESGSLGEEPLAEPEEEYVRQYRDEKKSRAYLESLVKPRKESVHETISKGDSGIIQNNYSVNTESSVKSAVDTLKAKIKRNVLS